MAKNTFTLYPQNSAPSLNLKLFANPTSEYRGTPFWSWNNKLDKDQLLRQLDQLKEMGFGGAHMHSRTGMGTEYLGDDFMAMVKACVEKCKKENMLAWLYDEDRWPSGFAGGLVTKDPQHRAKHLLWTKTPYKGGEFHSIGDSAARGSRAENGTLLGRWQVVLKDGVLASYKMLKPNEKSTQGTVWYAYLESFLPASWFNNQTYVDTLSPEAIQKFVEVTHERYRQIVGKDFGKTVPAIFTDEPQFTHKQYFRFAEENRDILIPWTTDFPETYKSLYKTDVFATLPEIFWELPNDKASLARYRYHDHVCERFATAFADTVGNWCAKNGIALTGHMMDEPSLTSQTAALGEAMRSYRSFQLPGIDMLCDWREYTTAKQAQSATHQFGYPGVVSELYGVTNWDFDFVGHKGQGDWQAALGVTVRVPHLAWVSMAGEAKRDYPAAIGYQSPWYKEYPLIEDHFSRLNVALTRGKPVVNVGVIHPVESFWLAWGPLEQTKARPDEIEYNFAQLTQWLLFGLIDFNYISESLLPIQNTKQTGSSFTVGKMKYDVVIVPPMRTIRSSTLSRLEAFAKAGGTVVFAGEIPTLVDAVPSNRPQKLANRCTCVEFTRPLILDAVQNVREVEVRLDNGGLADTLLSQIRQDGKQRHLFLCNTDRYNARSNTLVRIKGKWQVTALDTMTGKPAPVAATQHNGWTQLTHTFPGCGHLLLTLTPGSTKASVPAAKTTLTEVCRLSDPVKVTLSEPNVLLLDQAEFQIDAGPWQKKTEILRLDNAVRSHFKIPNRGGSIAQPWTDTAPAPVLGQVTLRFTIIRDTFYGNPDFSLALEQAADATITLNGQAIPSTVTGYYVDESIHTVKLPPLKIGPNELLITYPFTRKTNLEWMYLLGDFGVSLFGSHTLITAPVRELAFGDYTYQGLPFYAGNVTYHCTFTTPSIPAKSLTLRAHKFKAPLLTVALDGQRLGPIAFAPFEINLGKLAPNTTHILDITSYGNRHNAFSALHNCDVNLRWFGPGAWRSNGEHWTDQYQLKPIGILSAPVVLSTE